VPPGPTSPRPLPLELLLETLEPLEILLDLLGLLASPLELPAEPLGRCSSQITSSGSPGRLTPRRTPFASLTGRTSCAALSATRRRSTEARSSFSIPDWSLERSRIWLVSRSSLSASVWMISIQRSCFAESEPVRSRFAAIRIEVSGERNSCEMLEKTSCLSSSTSRSRWVMSPNARTRSPTSSLPGAPTGAS
jgi:hypothetical protein